MEAELQAAEPVEVELQQAHSDTQNLVLSLCYKLDIVIIEYAMLLLGRHFSSILVHLKTVCNVNDVDCPLIWHIAWFLRPVI